MGDKLQEFANRDNEIVSRMNVEFLDKDVTYEDAQKLAESKGGRLVTSEEAQLVFKHRAATTSSEEADTKTMFCYATSGSAATPATFACKLSNSDSKTIEDILGGEMLKESSPCSVLLWIKSKDVKDEDKKE